MKAIKTASALLLVGALTLPVGAQSTQGQTRRNDNASKTQSSLSNKDRKFAMEAASGGLMEVQLGQIAAERAASAEVRAFGQRMVTDHSQANQRLMSLAESKGLTLPTTMTGEHKQHFDQLSKLSGAEFDRMYMDHMAKDHKKDVSSFEQESKTGNDAGLRTFAQETLPTLREHLTMAQSLAGTHGASGHSSH